MGGLGSWLFGQETKTKKLPVYNQGQNQLLEMMMSQLMGGGQQGFGGSQGGYGNAMGILQQYLNPQSDIYKNFEQPYMDQFNQETIPMLAERFAGMGGGLGAGATSSSGFGQSIGAAGANLQHQLASMKSGMQRGSIQDILGQYNQMFNIKPFGYMQKPASAGFIPTVGAKFAEGAGQAAGAAMFA